MKNLIIVILTLTACSAYGQVDTSSALYINIKKQDSIFFERGFNRCDMDYLERTISQDLKFYHDQSGFQDRKIFFENMKKYICGTPDKKPIRKPKQGSFVVFPLYNNGVLYGAIQHGIHNFYRRVAGKEDVWTATAKFTSVWVLEKDNWMLSEVLSYDHQEPSESGD